MRMLPENRMVSISVSLSPHQIALVDAEADRRRVNRSEILRRLVDRGLGEPRSGQGGVSQVDPIGPANEVMIVDDCTHPRDKITRNPNGIWRCECGATSTDRGKMWATP